jgi:hypothetical protein
MYTDWKAVRDTMESWLRQGEFERAHEELRSMQACYEACVKAWADQGAKVLKEDAKATSEKQGVRRSGTPLDARKKELIYDFFHTLGPDYIKEPLMVKARSLKLNLDNVQSFRRSLVMRSKARVSSKLTLEWVVNNKQKAYRLASFLGLDYPSVQASGVTLEQIDASSFERVVIKPEGEASSKGVFLVFSPRRIYDVSRDKWLDSVRSMVKKMQEDLAKRRVRNDSWMVEELVLEDVGRELPGRDLKFYCFYGRVGMVLEIRRWGGRAYCEWSGDGSRIYSGKYSDQFDGDGVTKEQLEYVKTISKKIPVPFMRIDFLRSETAPYGLSFCEFTPRPGNFHAFGDEVDRMLGLEFLQAEARLENDLVKRRNSFREYRQLLGVVK